MDSFVYTLPTDPLARPLIEDLARDYDERYGLNDGVPSSFELQRYPAALFGDAVAAAFEGPAGDRHPVAHQYNERAVMRELERYPAALFGEASGGAFVVLVRDGMPIAGGAFKRSSDSVAEAKRVWTHPDFRRQGLARAVMRELEREAASRGYRTMELTTGARQPEAVGLYRSLGYEPLFDLEADYEEIGYLGFSKRLDDAAEDGAGPAEAQPV
jgi:ribosomal protein S18 acetylase RimI-like enzyme